MSVSGRKFVPDLSTSPNRKIAVSGAASLGASSLSIAGNRGGGSPIFPRLPAYVEVRLPNYRHEKFPPRSAKK